MKLRTLYRPVGLKELELIHQSGWKSFLAAYILSSVE